MDVDAAIFAELFSPATQGAIALTWEQGTRCDCFDVAKRQAAWGHEPCGGLGVLYANPVAVRGLFRDQSRWTSKKSSGEHGLGEASLTLPLTVKPAYTDDRLRDRFTVVDVPDDDVMGRVFYPAAQPVPFVFAGAQRAWRVQVQGMDQHTRTRPQP